MADTTPPKNHYIIKDQKIRKFDDSSYSDSMTEEAPELLFLFQQQAIAEDKHKRLIRASFDAFEQQLAHGSVRAN